MRSMTKRLLLALFFSGVLFGLPARTASAQMPPNPGTKEYCDRLVAKMTQVDSYIHEHTMNVRQMEAKILADRMMIVQLQAMGWGIFGQDFFSWAIAALEKEISELKNKIDYENQLIKLLSEDLRRLTIDWLNHCE